MKHEFMLSDLDEKLDKFYKRYCDYYSSKYENKNLDVDNLEYKKNDNDNVNNNNNNLSNEDNE